MSAFKWLTEPLGSMFKGVGNYFNTKQTNKHELQMARHNAKIERIARGDSAETDYDLLVLQNAASTIMDEIMILWLLAVVTCLFIPSLAPYALAGFTQLQAVPVWFQTIFVGAFISKLGLRFLFSGRTLFGKPIK